VLSKLPSEGPQRKSVMVETIKKPSSNRSAKERRNTLFRVLDGVLSMAHKKIHAGGNSDRAKLAGQNTTN
jgi:hypothetical protein